MNNYIEGTIYGLPKPKRKGHNTSAVSRRRNKEYVHKVVIYGIPYYKVHVGRGGKSKIKYFRKFKEAKLFRDFLRVNRYL